MNYNKILVIFALLVTIAPVSYSQIDPWVRFYDDTGRYGFVDLDGVIRVPIKFEKSYLDLPDTFYNIIPVLERTDEKFQWYYLLKDGRKAGIDSVYAFDWSLDCEGEGKIRFQDRIADRVGFLDNNGKVIIPAVYNYAYPFRNGFSLAKRNAVRKCFDEVEDEVTDLSNCEHWGWEGGEYVLINEKNEIIVENVEKELWDVNWYVTTTDVTTIDTSLYIGLNGRDDTTYWFLDYKKEFTAWFYKDFLRAVSRSDSSIEDYLFNEVGFHSESGWKQKQKNKFLVAFPHVLKPARFVVFPPNQIYIRSETLNPFRSNHHLFRQFYDGCGDYSARHPVFAVMIEYYKKRDKPFERAKSAFIRDFTIDYREHFCFIRTHEGYKLYEAVVKR